MEKILEVIDLSVTFGEDIQALKEVSFEMFQGEIVGLVGESGSGKSTLGLSIAGLLNLNKKANLKGKVTVTNIDVLSANEEQLSRIRGTGIFVIFQDPFQSLDPLMTIGDHLGEAYKIRRERDGTVINPLDLQTAVITALKRVNFENPEIVLSKYPHELSGGQNQRIMIAMAILEKPFLLIADEPTTALDVTTQAQVLRLLKKIVKEENMALLFITHDLAVASMLCDRIIVLYDGMIQEIGAVDEIITNPLHPYTKGLINSMPTGSKRDTRLKFIKGLYVHNEIIGGCPFYPRCDYRKNMCLEMIPPLVEINGRKVRCVLYDH
ncbi:MAG: ABC transporter ATP-binding protein [Thermoplasmata archaeon]